jgi:Ca2+-binding EF-hand superfamily protein
MEEPRMSNISGISNSMMSSMLQGMQSRPDPAQKFKELDTDSSGGLDKTELSTMAKELSKMTGKTLNVDDSIKNYDANNDGQLSQDEMEAMMQKTMRPPTSDGSSMQQVIDAYQTNSGDDQISTLLKMLEQNSSTSSTSSSSASNSSDDTISILLKMLEQSASSNSTSNSRPDPEVKFKELDSDGSGGLNKSELDVMAEDISSMTGQTMDTDKAISTYDADKNGELSKTEMDTMMKATMEKAGGSQQTLDTNQANSNNNDQVDLLRQLLEQYANNLSTDSYKNLTSSI